MVNKQNVDLTINWDKGVQIFGGDEDSFRMFLEKFESYSFSKFMEQLFDGIMQMDYVAIHEASHTIKGAASYIAADKTVKFTKELMDASDRHEDQTVLKLYGELLKESKSLLKEIERLVGTKPNLALINEYEKKFKIKYPKGLANSGPRPAELEYPTNPPPGCCAACNIF